MRIVKIDGEDDRAMVELQSRQETEWLTAFHGIGIFSYAIIYLANPGVSR